MQGFYDRDGCFWKEVENVTVVGACASHSMAGHTTSPRFARQFTIIHKAAPTQSVLKTTLTGMLDQLFQQVSEDLQAVKAPIADASIALCQEASTSFLPTPKKQHYSFSVRQVFGIIKVINLIYPQQNMTCCPSILALQSHSHLASAVGLLMISGSIGTHVPE